MQKEDSFLDDEVIVGTLQTQPDLRASHQTFKTDQSPQSNQEIDYNLSSDEEKSNQKSYTSNYLRESIVSSIISSPIRTISKARAQIRQEEMKREEERVKSQLKVKEQFRFERKLEETYSDSSSCFSEDFREVIKKELGENKIVLETPAKEKKLEDLFSEKKEQKMVRIEQQKSPLKEKTPERQKSPEKCPVQISLEGLDPGVQRLILQIYEEGKRHKQLEPKRELLDQIEQLRQLNQRLAAFDHI